MQKKREGKAGDELNYKRLNQEEAQTKILSFTVQLEFGSSCRHDGLALFPLFGPDSERELAYLTLEEAIACDFLEVREGKVAKPQELVAENKSDQMVLIIDGEEIVGGRQNRIVNSSVLLPFHTSIVLPVSCVEGGRWRVAKRNARAGGVAFPSLRTTALGKGTNHRADQLHIWASIRERGALFHHQPPTNALRELYDQQEDSLARYAAVFRYPQNSKGVIAAMANGLICADIFSQARTLAKFWPKLIRSYALDAIAWRGGEMVNKGEGERLIDALPEARFQVHPSVGLGQSVRIEGKDLRGSAIVYVGQVVHLALFATPSPPTRMQARSHQSSSHYPPLIQLGA